MLAHTLEDFELLRLFNGGDNFGSTYFLMGLNKNRSFKLNVGQYADIWRELEKIMNFSSIMKRPDDEEWGR